MVRKCVAASFVLAASAAWAAAPVRTPLFFEPNQGQAHPNVDFLSRGNGVVSYLTARGAVLRVGRSPVRMHFQDAGASKPEGIDRLPGSTSYFAGKDPGKWRAGIPQFGKVRYREVYPGIDLVYYGRGGELEYDFEIAPGADPGKIRIAYDGARRLKLDSNGDLVLSTPDGGDLRQKRPTVYQERDGKRIEIAASYIVDGRNGVRIKTGAYDSSRKLIIDPVLQYSTFLGTGGQDSAAAVRVDQSGNVYIAGTMATPASDANPFVSASNDPYGRSDAVVIKYAPSTNQVLFVAHIRGSGRVVASRLAVDAQGSMYLSGTTDAADFPLVNSVGIKVDPTFFIPWMAKIASNGSTLEYSTFLTGRAPTGITAMAVDSAGNAYATGSTSGGGGFPWTGGVAPNTAGVFLAKLSPAGALLFAKPYECSCQPTALAVDASGIYMAGTANPVTFPQKTPFTPANSGKYPLFATKFSLDGENVIYASMFGGTRVQTAYSAVADSQGSLYLGGATTSTDFPLVNPTQSSAVYRREAFVAQLNAQGNGLVYSTYLGGSASDEIQDLAFDPSGNLYLGGVTSSPDFPIMNPMMTWKAKPANQYPQSYAFVTKLAAESRALVYSTLLGGIQADTAQPGSPSSDRAFGITADAAGNAYVVGSTYTADFPVANAFQSRYSGTQDMFLSVLAPDSGSTALVTAQPSVLTFTMTIGGASPPPQVLTTSAGATATASTTTGGNWLVVTPTGDSSRFNVSVNPAGLAVGNYAGAISLSAGGGAARNVGVVFRVLSPVPVLTTASPETLQPVVGLAEGPKVTISGSSFVSGAFATVAGSFGPPQEYPVTVINSSTVELVLPGGYVDAGSTIVVTISNPGTEPSNPVEFIVSRPTPFITRVTNAASGTVGPISPGQIVTIQGLKFGGFPETAPANPPVTTLHNVRVLFDGVAAPLLYVAGISTEANVGQTTVSPFSQANVIAPPSLAGKTSTVVQVEYRGVLSQAVTVPVGLSSVGLFTADGSGRGQASALNEDGAQNTVSTPAATGAAVTLFATGTGTAADMTAAVTIDGQPAEVIESTIGQETGGVARLSIRIPSSARAGSSIPVAVRVGDSQSQSGVTLSIRSSY